MNLSPDRASWRRRAAGLASRALGALLAFAVAGAAWADAAGVGNPSSTSGSAPGGGNGSTAPEPAIGGCRVHPCVALVLSGGGARGFAHLGVIEVLQRLHVPIDVVAGTSMGAIVGGGYAAGYTAPQLQQLVASTDWKAMFIGHPPRAEMDWRRKEDDLQNLSNLEFGIRNGGLTLPQALAGSQRLELFLRRLGGPAKDVRNLAELPVPYVAMATDLATGEPVELQKDISLSAAMRASMAVPGAFAPLDVGGHLLVDGGLTDNIPVAQALAMGADVIIAVDVSTPPLPREKLGDIVGVAEQLAVLLGLDPKRRALASLRPQDILIEPQLARYGSSDFADYARIIEAGRAATEALAQRLQQLDLDPARYAAREAERTRLVRDEAPLEIAAVDVRRLKTVNADAVKAEIDIAPGTRVTTENIEHDIDRIYRTGDFEAVDYGIVGDPGRRTLLIAPYEKSWGYNTLRFGGSLQTNFREDNTFSLLVAQTWRWIDAWGGEWRNLLQIGEPFEFTSEFYQPLGAGSAWYVLPRVQRLRAAFQVYQGSTSVAQLENVENSAQLLFGHSLAALGTVEAGFARSELSTTQLIGTPQPAIPTTYSNDLVAHVRLDRLDAANFPHEGYYFDAGVTDYRSTVGSAERQKAYTLELDAPLRLGRTTAYLTARAETAVQQSRVQLGGLFNLSGTAVGEVAGAHGALLRGLFYRNISGALGDIAMPIYAGLSLEAGNALPTSQELEIGGLRHAGALFLGADSYIGPVYLALGRTQHGSTAVYLLLGRPR